MKLDPFSQHGITSKNKPQYYPYKMALNSHGFVNKKQPDTFHYVYWLFSRDPYFMVYETIPTTG